MVLGQAPAAFPSSTRAAVCENSCVSNDSTALPTLPSDLRLGPVHIVVTDLDRSADFYERAIGLRPHSRDGAEATVGTDGADLLVLHEDPHAKPAGRHAGLYHFALLHPSRAELGRAVQRLAATATPIQGASDHGISEAIYLPDPDGNGIELAADQPRERWGDLRDPTTIGPAPLDLPGLIAAAGPEGAAEPASRELSVGHLHLHVGDVERGLTFYRDLIGFEVMTDFGSAAFVAAGGYHHHLGFNTWRGEGVPPAPAGRVGLEHWTVLLPEAADVEAIAGRLAGAEHAFERSDGAISVADPWGNRLLIAAEQL